MINESILWRRLDHPGHESARLFDQSDTWNLQGTAVFSYEQLPCRLDYLVVCDSRWHTQSARINGWVGNTLLEIAIAVSADQHWSLNEKEVLGVRGCVDFDLNFSPSTNLLPIRRLDLAVGQEAEVRAAWLRFPSFELEPLLQVYRRIDESTYHYESNGGEFVTELSVNEMGFVVNYPDLWEPEGSRGQV
ncbi:MAG TPA: putative glycolipid-binding domain-containing protein [Anaerolineales bacterium]|nr:putative glycolipid-binding domain-containing protein [Anaerolineales bacterium]